MLIVSKFHDYYDPVGKSKGIDKTIVYNRETRSIDKAPGIPMMHYSERYSRKDNRVLDFYTFIIGFCGKLYPIGFLDQDGQKKFLHTHEQIVEKYLELNQGKRKIKSYFNYWVNKGLNELSSALTNSELLGLFQKYKVPIFVYTDIANHQINPLMTKSLDLNPRLTTFQFVKVMDPYQAFQELEMYISGVLGVGEHPTVKVSDKSKIIEHGFDYKWSFRKEPKVKK
jgi:hypothetical protein